MQYQVDLVKEVILLISPDHHVVDAFLAEGRTQRLCDEPVAFYTYRSSLTLPGHCLLCGRNFEQPAKACVSSGGFHAFVGVDQDDGIDQGHLAENRSASFLTITFEDLPFFLETDQLFPVEEIAVAIPV